jgi:Amt family ammonium transporter
LKFTIPFALFAFFQMKFAVITPALISGALAERINFRAFVLFMILFCVVVYAPLAHWTWHPDGFLFNLGVLDFAGGTVVHMSAGWAALAGALYLRRRKSHIESNILPPANIPYVLLGTGLLWFGWFGFNAGSALAANGTAGLAFMNTQVAAAAAVLGWLLVEKIRNGHATSLGAASGAVAGLVAITPACAFVAPWAAVVIGLIAGALCALCVGIKYALGFDDSLDVVAVHLIGGIWGSLSIGLFGSSAVNSLGLDGILYGGGTALLGKQALGVGMVLVYSFIATLIIGYAIEKTIGFRVKRDAEVEGIDLSEHAETAYEMTSSSRGGSLL